MDKISKPLTMYSESQNNFPEMMMGLYKEALVLSERNTPTDRILAAVILKDLYEKTKHIQDTWDWVSQEDRDNLQPMIDDLLQRIKDL